MLGARYYDEATGTFVSVDPQLDPQQPAQFHAYVYSGNNPMTWSDPSGLWWNPIKAVAKAAKSVGSWAKRNQAEIIGAVAGTVVFAGCMAGSFGLGSVGCGVAAGAVGGAVTQAWKTDVQHTERFSWGSLATATVFGGISGFAGGVLGEAASTFIAPVAKTAVAAVTNSVRSVTSKAASSAGGAARAIGTGAKAVAKRATGTASKANDAANGGVVRHYTTSGAAESIMKGGRIEPGLKSGKVWVTPDRYASGAEARAKLALDKTPDGYFEIPMCRVKCPTGPSPVKPWNGQPGGGTEITTEFGIDIRGLIFRTIE